MIEKLEKKYQTDREFILLVDDLQLQEGEFFALLGESGSGKTTLLKLIAGLLMPDRGDLFLNGKPISGLPAEKRGFSMVFQQPLLFPHMNILDNVTFGLKMKGIGKQERNAKGMEILKKMGLSGFEKRYPSQLSGGQQQRVALGRSLVTQPRLLLMDEPFSSLDPTTREEMRDWLREIHRSFGVTILFVTHDPREAFYLADRIGIMDEGVLVQLDEPRKLYEQPVNVKTAKLLGIRNLIAGRVKQGRFVSDSGVIELQLHGQDLEGYLMILPEAIRMRKGGVAGAEELPGTISQIAFVPGFSSLKVEIGKERLEVMQRMEDSYAWSVGESVLLAFNQEALRFIRK
ncbi:ABC transporter ATP-binding protein [Ammoniphilus resinae]|nr:ABC transporter ATP-binding protein [Ammoniphilus resinae]